MLKHLKAFALWLLPILKTTSLAVAADTISEMAYPARRPRTSYSQMPRRYTDTVRPHTNYSGLRNQKRGETNTSLDDARRQAGLPPIHPFEDESRFMVEFIVDGPTRLTAANWLLDNLPEVGKGGEKDEIELVSWRIVPQDY